MSREVLGESGPDVNRPPPRLAERPPAVPLTDLDRPDSPEPAPQAPGGAPWWRSGWAVVAAAAVAALLATVATAGVLDRRYERARLDAVRLLVDVELDGRDFEVDRDDRLLNLDLVVFNAGQDHVDVVDVAFPGGGGSSIGVREETPVPAGEPARVPAQVQLDCTSRPPSALELTVRTQDGRVRSVQPTSFTGSRYLAEPLRGMLGWVCSSAGQPQIDVWSTTAQDDGSLTLQLRNPSDEPAQIEFSGPTGTRILTEPPSPILVDGRDGEFVRLRVQVDRCTSAAQRASAADDLVMSVDGEVWGTLWADSPSVLAGWMARSVALVCG